jgi:excisionase family DNA binding protein
MGKKKPARLPQVPPGELMSTRELAAYLHVRERKVYDLIRTGKIPCTRVTGKWLFSKGLIDQWLAGGFATPGGKPTDRPGSVADSGARPISAPAVIAGSHDPLTEWAVRESGSGLALLPGGSLDGLRRLAAGQALVCGLHVQDPDGGEYNVAALKKMLPGLDVVAIRWVERQQGLVLAPGNPLGIRSLAHLRTRRARIVQRQPDAGSQVLLLHLLRQAGLDPAELRLLPQPRHTHLELGLAILEGQADVGLAVAAVAMQLKLDFLPLHRERYDLVMRRRDYFEPAFQKLLAFASTAAFAQRAADLGGYDLADLGRVVYNAP